MPRSSAPRSPFTPHRRGGTESVRNRLAALGALALLAAASGCAYRGDPSLRPEGPSSRRVGVFRARAELSDEPARRFRMLLFAERPDRFHAEVLGPVGGPRLIVDAGGGRVAVSVVADRTAYVGPLAPGAALDFLGLDVSLQDLVAALLGEDVGPDVPPFRRVPLGGRGLPVEFEIATPRGSLALERLRFSRGNPRESIGTGAAPDGFRVRPLEDLGAGGDVLLGSGGEGQP